MKDCVIISKNMLLDIYDFISRVAETEKSEESERLLKDLFRLIVSFDEIPSEGTDK
jgi:hypothetical protein